MKISVIVPTLNEESLIFSLVESILATGSLAVVEVIVVDGGSTDKTVMEAKKSRGYSVELLQKFKGESNEPGGEKCKR